MSYDLNAFLQTGLILNVNSSEGGMVGHCWRPLAFTDWMSNLIIYLSSKFWVRENDACVQANWVPICPKIFFIYSFMYFFSSSINNIIVTIKRTTGWIYLIFRVFLKKKFWSWWKLEIRHKIRPAYRAVPGPVPGTAMPCHRHGTVVQA